MHSCPHVLQCRLPFPLFISCFFSSVYSAHVSPHTPLLTNPPSLWPHSFFLPAFTHPCISSSLQLKECQQGLSSAPLQRPLWLSPPHVLPPTPPNHHHLHPHPHPHPHALSLSLSVQPPVPIRGLCGRENPWSKPYQQQHIVLCGFHVFGRHPQCWWFWGKERPVICLRLWHPIEVSIVQQKSGVLSWQFLFDSYYFNDLSYFHYRPKIPVEPKLSFVQTAKEELDDSAVLNYLIGLLI